MLITAVTSLILYMIISLHLCSIRYNPESGTAFDFTAQTAHGQAM
jgi:hypothetical protein